MNESNKVSKNLDSSFSSNNENKSSILDVDKKVENYSSPGSCKANISISEVSCVEKVIRKKSPKNEKKSNEKKRMKKINDDIEKYKKLKNEPKREKKAENLDENKYTKKKKKEEILKMVERLSKSPPRKQVENDSPKKIATDPHIFERLFKMSTEKEQKIIKERKQKLKKEKINPLASTLKSNSKSQQLAQEKLLSYVKGIFINETNNEKFEKSDDPEVLKNRRKNKGKLTQEELISLLIKLGLLYNRQKISQTPILEEQLKEWILEEKENGEKIYDIQKVRETLIAALESSQTNSPLNKYIKQCILISIANSESKKLKQQESLEIQKQQDLALQRKIPYESIIRLSKSNRPPSPRREMKKRPAFIQNPQLYYFQDASISPGSDKILRTSDFARKSFKERDELLAKKKSDKIKKLTDDFYKSKVIKFEHKPKFSPEVKREVNEYRKRKQNRKPEEPSYKPKIIDYEKYKKTIYQNMLENNHPEGWDDYVQRSRIAYQKRIEKLRSKEIEYLKDDAHINEESCFYESTIV